MTLSVGSDWDWRKAEMNGDNWRKCMSTKWEDTKTVSRVSHISFLSVYVMASGYHLLLCCITATNITPRIWSSQRCIFCSQIQRCWRWWRRRTSRKWARRSCSPRCRSCWRPSMWWCRRWARPSRRRWEAPLTSARRCQTMVGRRQCHLRKWVITCVHSACAFICFFMTV